MTHADATAYARTLWAVVERELGCDLARYLRQLRSKGLGTRRMVDVLNRDLEATDVRVTRRTVQRWCTDLELPEATRW